MPKIIIVGFVVAISQLISVFTVSYLSLTNNFELMALWATLESNLVLITSILFFGHQHTLNRKLISCSLIFKKIKYMRSVQQTIFSMSILVCFLFICLALVSNEKLYFLIELFLQL